MVMAPSNSIRGDVAAWARTHRIFVWSNRCVAALNRATSKCSITKAFTMPIPVNVSWTRLLMSAILSWLERLDRRIDRPILADGSTTKGTKTRETRASFQSTEKITASNPSNVKECFRKSAETWETTYWILSVSLLIADIRRPVGFRLENAMDC